MVLGDKFTCSSAFWLNWWSFIAQFWKCWLHLSSVLPLLFILLNIRLFLSLAQLSVVEAAVNIDASPFVSQLLCKFETDVWSTLQLSLQFTLCWKDTGCSRTSTLQQHNILKRTQLLILRSEENVQKILISIFLLQKNLCV